MKKVFLKYLAEKIDELLTKADEQMATKTDLTKKVDKVEGKGLSTNDYTTAEKNKLAGIQEGAQKNRVTSVRGAFELNPQVGDVVISAGSIGLGDANTRLTALENDKLDKSEKGATNGVASLDENGRVPSSQLPSYVDDVIEVANYESLPTSGESGKIYITQSDNKTYRWSGSGYAEISASLALGEVTGTAYDGAKGKQNATNIANLDSNKLGKTEKAADSAKADSASALTNKSTTLTSTTEWAITYHIVQAADVGSLPYGDNANAVITIPSLGGLKYHHQLGFTGLGVFHRKLYNKDIDTTTLWSQIAFTNSTVANAEKLGGVAAADYMQKSGGTFTGNVTAPKFIGALQGNADSATKLATPRTIWGQRFDGTGDVNGNATITGQLNVGSYIVSIRSGGDNTIQADNGTAIADMRVTSAGSVILMRWKDGAGKVIIESDGINTTLRTGNVGIGTTTPSEKLEVAGNIKASGMLTTGSDAHVGGAIDIEGGITSRGDIDASGNNILGNLAGTIAKNEVAAGVKLQVIGLSKTAANKSVPYVTPIEITDNDMVVTGTMTATATYHSSDERLKTFEGNVEVDLEKLKALPKKYFYWTADAEGKRQLGTSAQAVEEVFPELVSTDADGYKSVNYANLSVVALAAVDKLAEQNAELERRLAKIEKLLNIE